MHTNIYQSKIRKQIQTIYGNEIIEENILGKKFRGLKKTKKIGQKFISISWFQILGVNLGSDYSAFEGELQKIKTKYKHNMGNVLFQFGFVDEIGKIDRIQNQDKNGEAYSKVLSDNNFWNKKMSQLGLTTTIRENMPPSTFIIDLELSDEDLRSKMSSQAIRYLKKSKSKNLQFQRLRGTEKNTFYDLRQETSSGKGFHIITKEQFDKLYEFLQGNTGGMRVSKSDDKILAGGIYFVVDDTLVYLYGFGNREPGLQNLGGHYHLKYGMINRAKAQNLKKFDLFGGSGIGQKKSALKSVDEFKFGLGAQKVCIGGSYDLVLNPFLHRLFYLRQKIKKS